MLIRYPPHSKGQWKYLVLASDSSNQQTFAKKISVESVQMIFKACNHGTFVKIEYTKNVHTWKFNISKLISEN